MAQLISKAPPMSLEAAGGPLHFSHTQFLHDCRLVQSFSGKEFTRIDAAAQFFLERYLPSSFAECEVWFIDFGNQVFSLT